MHCKNSILNVRSIQRIYECWATDMRISRALGGGLLYVSHDPEVAEAAAATIRPTTAADRRTLNRSRCGHRGQPFSWLSVAWFQVNTQLYLLSYGRPK